METQESFLQAVVEPLHKTSSKFDLVFKGDVLKFRIFPHNNDIAVAYVKEVKMKDTIPPFMVHMMPPEDLEQMTDRTVVAQVIKVKWWEKFLGITARKKVIKWVDAKRAEIDKLNRADQGVENLKSSLGM